MVLSMIGREKKKFFTDSQVFRWFSLFYATPFALMLGANPHLITLFSGVKNFT